VRRVALFDWNAGGHRPIYVHRFVEALSDSVDMVLALPQSTLDAVGDLEAETISLGDARPPFGRLTLRRRAVLPEEVEKLRVVSARVDQTVHLSADHALFRLASAEPFPSLVTLVLYHLRAHYGALYGTPLPYADRAIAYAKDRAVRRWRRRSDALSVFVLDEELAKQAPSNGAPVHWLPEPPVASLPLPRIPSRREGCVLYGALAPRKGIDLLAGALCASTTRLKLVLAGVVDPPDFEPELTRLAQAMEQVGVEVDLRPRHHSELEGLEVLASACCAVLPYPRHAGMSRVLVEAASVGTPVVADRFGLLGHLVRTHRLGLAVDATDPPALRAAVLELADPERAASYAEALARFAARFTRERFREALVLGLELDARVEPITSTSTSAT
jgi:glycosyltransferase involved in cell wall biosynthesis